MLGRRSGSLKGGPCPWALTTDAPVGSRRLRQPRSCDDLALKSCLHFFMNALKLFDFLGQFNAGAAQRVILLVTKIWSKGECTNPENGNSKSRCSFL